MDNILKTAISNHFKNTELGFLRIKKNLNIVCFTDTETEAYIYSTSKIYRMKRKIKKKRIRIFINILSNNYLGKIIGKSL